MAADIELLPLPSHLENALVVVGNGDDVRNWIQRHARANVAHATAPLQAEIERLRAEREVIVAEAMKYASKSGRLEAKVERLAEALRASLEAVRGALQDAYHSAGQECCGRGGMHGCCGMPDAVWTPEDQAVMDKLTPIERLLNAALREHDQKE